MQETKLDKVIDRLFRFVERITNNLANNRNSIRHYLGYIIILIYIPAISIVFIDIYYNGWKFKLLDGAINISFISRLVMVFFVYPFQIFFFNRPLFQDFDSKLLKISSKIFLEKVVNDCFKPIIADWREEYFKAINENHKCQAFLINFRYVYAFLAAIIQQSSLRRLFEIMRIFTK